MLRFMLLLWVLIIGGSAEVTLTTNSTPETVTVETTTVDRALSDGPYTNERPTPVRLLGELTNLTNGISSGKIVIVGNNSIEISNFYFDGQTPRTFVLMGKNEISSNGTIVPVNDSIDPLKVYNGQNLKLTLPNNSTIDDIDWLAIKSFESQQTLAYIFLRNRSVSYPPQTFGLKKEVTSGPVILVNKKTFFIPNFRYRGDHPNVHFWVGNGSEPSVDGVQIPDETGSFENLKPYHGQNLYLNLPDDLSTDNIEYFGVWSIDEEVSLGSVPIKGIEGVPEIERKVKTFLADEKIVMRLPKCCPFGSVLTVNGCNESLLMTFQPTFNVYEHNETHFRNESLDLDLIRFELYNFSPSCPSGKYPLDDENEEFSILVNGSLLLKGAAGSGIWAQDSFCLENIEDGNNAFEMKILICAPALSEANMHKAMFITYVTFTIISTFCLAVTFLLYYFWLKVEDVHRKCFTGYVFAMTLAFLSLTIVQTAGVDGSGCEVLGFLFQFSMIASFTLLGILCFDITFIIHYIDEDKKRRKRVYCYLAIALGVPVLFLIISLSRNLTPDVPNSFFKPQYENNLCYFDSDQQRTIYFYFPICLSILTSFICLIMAKIKIIKNDRQKMNDYFWLENGTSYKFMWRKYLIVVVTSLLWFIESAISLNYANANMLIAIDLVEASLGILVFLLFVVNKQTRKEIIKSYKSRRRNKEHNSVKEEDFFLGLAQL